MDHGPKATIGEGPVCTRFTLFHSVQLRLMKDMPDTLDETLKLAIQQESVETAQKRLSSERSSVAASSTDETTATAVDNSEGLSAMSVYQLRKQAQESERLVQNIRRQIEELNRRLLGKEKTTVADQTRPSPAFSKRPGSSATCWNC